MAKIIPLFTVCLINLSLSSCLHRAESQKMLDVRADYQGKEQAEASSLKLGIDDHLPGHSDAPVRTAPKTAHIWIYPHETPTKEYFWGGWMSVVVEGDRWVIDKPADFSPTKPIITPTVAVKDTTINK